MHLAQALDHGLADHVVGQARKRRAAHDVGRAGLDEVDHLGREQPALAHRVAQRQHLLGLGGQLEDVGVGLEARGLGEHLVDGLAEALDELDAGHVREAARGLGAELGVGVDRVGHAKEEEVHQARDVGLAALLLDDLDHLVVGRGVELDEDLAHHAHARLGAVVLQRQRLEGVDGALAELVEAAARRRGGGDQSLGLGHHAVVERIGGAGLGLVGAAAVEQLHDEVAVEQGVDRLDQDLGLEDGEARVLLVQAGGRGERDHRDLGVAGVLERLADERDVVGGAAAAAGLGDDDGRAGEVVLAGEDRLHDLAGHQDGRVADVVVDVLEARLHGALVHGRQQHHVEARALEKNLEQVKVDRRHLRHEDGVAGLLHVLGVADLLEGGTGGLAVDGHAAGRGGAGALDRAVGVVDAHGLDLADLALGGGAAQLLALLLERGHERADADARRAQVGDLVDLEDGVDLARGLEDLLDLVGGQGVKAAAKREELDEVEVVAGGNEARRAVEAAVEHPLVDHADGALGLHLVRDGVLGEHGKAEGVHE